MLKNKGLQVSSLILWTIFCNVFTCIYSHGLMTDPRQRGALVVKNRLVSNLDEAAPFDPYAHFPSGDKDIFKGAGKRSVVRAANNVWTPYEPLRHGFIWRAGVCGDELGMPQEHLKGGRYYFPSNDAIRVRTYTQRDIVDFESNIVTHHNGFLEFFICNIDECGNDISIECFKKGYCQQLFRAPSYCDNGNFEECGPIDEKYPGRWYLPCGPFPTGQILYGGRQGSMKYMLPGELICQHCVIQWYWTSANTCNPPGVVEYFEGVNKPRWRDCRGQGGAIGGYTKVQRPCEGDRFPEEYWQCADVRIVSRNSRNGTPGDGNVGLWNNDENEEGDDRSGDVANDNRVFPNIEDSHNGVPSTFGGPGGGEVIEGNTYPSTQEGNDIRSEGQKSSETGPSSLSESLNGITAPFVVTSGISNIQGIGAFGIPRKGDGERGKLVPRVTPTVRPTSVVQGDGDVDVGPSVVTKTPAPRPLDPEKRTQGSFTGVLGKVFGS